MKGKVLVIALGLFILSAVTVSAQDFCNGDFNYNGSVAAEDVTEFLNHFGRSQFNNPCPSDGPARPAATGQRISYAPGDDGFFEIGVVYPILSRFTDNGDGTVKDKLTGLIWLKNANCFGQRTWSNAISDANGLADGSCGLTDGSQAGDWRLPNMNELNSLVNRRYHNPAMSDATRAIFDGEQAADYWSSTSSVEDPDNLAWHVYMYNGIQYNLPKETNNFHVLPVRSYCGGCV